MIFNRAQGDRRDDLIFSVFSPGTPWQLHPGQVSGLYNEE